MNDDEFFAVCFLRVFTIIAMSPMLTSDNNIPIFLIIFFLYLKEIVLIHKKILGFLPRISNLFL